MAQFQAYPLQWPAGWPRTPAGKRKDANFRQSWRDSVDGLIAEIRRLGGADLVISTNVPQRRDGTPYADQAQDAIPDPGVAVFFTLKGKARAMARDAHFTVHQNLHSIRLAIEYLRGLERHGGGTMMDRAFEGFLAIEAPGSKPWWSVLGVAQDAPTAAIERAFRDLAKQRHPDRGGSEAMMAELNAARAAALARR